MASGPRWRCDQFIRFILRQPTIAVRALLRTAVREVRQQGGHCWLHCSSGRPVLLHRVADPLPGLNLILGFPIQLVGWLALPHLYVRYGVEGGNLVTM